MPFKLDGDRYYTVKEFSETVDREYSYIRKCIRGLGRAKDLTDHVRRIENKPFIRESALEEFDE